MRKNIRLKHMRSVKLEDFFKNLESKNIEANNRTRWYMLIPKKAFGIIAFLIVSLIGGILLAVIPSLFVSATMQTVIVPLNYWENLPKEIEDEIVIAERNVLYDINGNVFAEVWAENRVILDSLDEISQYAIDSLIMTEDKRFLEHVGFDIIGTTRSFLKSSGGGSGITQQLIKNLQYYNSAGTEESKSEATEHSLDRKLRELKYALEYEKTHTKEEILLSYFNIVAFGSPNIYSIEAASNYFFDKTAKDLTLAEASALVGTVQNPVKYNMDKPDNNTWKDRQRIVLLRLVDEGIITQEEADEASAEELILVKKSKNGNCTASNYPSYCEYVINELKNSEKLGETLEDRETILAKGGLHIYTYLDPDKTDLINNYLFENVGTDNRPVMPIALVQPGTGGVLAMGVNREYGEGDGKTTINVPLNPTGSGSVYKVFTLAAALANGFEEEDLTFSSRCPLKDNNYDMPGRGYVRNSTSCELQGGTLNYQEAMAYSSNTWFTELIIKVGVENVKNFSRSIGLNAPDYIGRRSISYTLGTVPDSPVNVAAAFATFANEGIYCPATPIKSYSYENGTIPAIPDSYDPIDSGCKRVLSPHDSGIVLKALRANVSGEVPNAFGLDKKIDGYDVVGKSGTNQLYNTTWTHISKDYSIYANIYDMDKLTNGIGTVRFKNRWYRWQDNVAGIAATEIMTSLLAGTENKPLNYESKDDTIVEVPVSNREFFYVPNTIGMTPEAAKQVFENINMTVNISQEQIDKPNDAYPSGVVIKQEVSAGTRLAIGTTKEQVLYLSK